MKTNIKTILFMIAAVTADCGYAQELKLNMDSALTISLGTKALLTYQFKTPTLKRALIQPISQVDLYTLKYNCSCRRSSSRLLCMFVASYRHETETVDWDPAKERFKNDDEANEMLSRSQRKEYEVKA